MKRISKCLIVLCSVSMMVLSSCGSSKLSASPPSAFGTANSPPSGNSQLYGTATGGSNGAVLGSNTGAATLTDKSTAAPSTLPATTAALPTPVSSKMVKTAFISISVDKAQSTYDDIIANAQQNGGYEFSQNLNKDGENYNVMAVVKISPDKLDAFLAFISKQGELNSSQVTSQDITSQYVDTQQQLKILQDTLTAYNQMLATTTKTADQLTIIAKISELTNQIQNYQTQLNTLNSQVAYSTVNINIVEKTNPHAIIHPVAWTSLSGSDVLTNMKNGFLNCINIVFSVLKWLAIILVTLSPLLIIAGAVLLIRRKYKKSRSLKFSDDFSSDSHDAITTSERMAQITKLLHDIEQQNRLLNLSNPNSDT